jgi:membrane carboxypeptidase/penicillin-binding protein
MNRVGVKEQLSPDVSLPLGTGELNLIDFLTGYNTLANEGVKVDLYLIDRVEDAKGKVIYEHKMNEEQVLDKNITFIVNDLLTTTYDYNMIDYNSPSCINIAAKISKKWAIKTGTTDVDALTIGYNKDLLVGVWTGYDNNQKLETGESKYSRYIWVDTAEGYLKDKETSWYKMPENVVGVLMNPLDGTIANEQSNKKRILYYLKGSEPVDR